MEPRALPVLLSLPLAAGAAPAVLECSFAGDAPVVLRFDFDADQFSPPVSAEDPPRRRVSRVRMGAEEFRAEALMIGDTVRGFTFGPREMMLTTTRDGAAMLSLGDRDLDGRCVEVAQ